MASKVKVIFEVKTSKSVDKVYVCGNVAELGSWNPKKAIELKYDDTKSSYTVSKMLTSDEIVEYKVLSKKDWSNVEIKDGYDVSNHSFVVSKGHVEVVEVEDFK